MAKAKKKRIEIRHPVRRSGVQWLTVGQFVAMFRLTEKVVVKIKDDILCITSGAVFYAYERPMWRRLKRR